MTRYECSLNGVNLSGISPAIVITDITEAVTESATVEARPLGNGSRFLRKQRERLDVTVSFAIREQDITRRQLISHQVQKWARDGGYLIRNDRSDQRLKVVCTGIPVLESALHWTDIFTATFTAFESPFWESTALSSVTLTDTGTLYVPGTAETAKAAFVLTNTGSSTLNTATIRTGASTMSFSSLGIPANGKLEVGYDDNGYLYIKANGASAFGTRSTGSSDDFLVKCGYSEIRFTSNVAARLRVTARGVWL